MIKRDDAKSRITFRCDTPHCKAEIETPSPHFDRAARFARKEDWAIGTEGDACPGHHV